MGIREKRKSGEERRNREGIGIEREGRKIKKG